MWNGLVALLDGDPAGSERFAEAMVSVRPSDRNLVASSAGMIVAVDRWRGTLSERASGLSAYATSEPGLPRVRDSPPWPWPSTATAGAGGARRPARPRPLLADDSTLGAQLAAITEACALTGTAVPSEVAAGLVPFSGQLLVSGWGIDVPGPPTASWPSSPPSRVTRRLPPRRSPGRRRWRHSCRRHCRCARRSGAMCCSAMCRCRTCRPRSPVWRARPTCSARPIRSVSEPSRDTDLAECGSGASLLSTRVPSDCLRGASRVGRGSPRRGSGSCAG